jgi:nitrogen fixation protein NifB
VHLPVAPKCNVQCNFCDRKYCCVNESRPGVTATLFTPQQAFEYIKNLFNSTNNISVIGIAGPGDPFANSRETLETFSLIRKAYPDTLLCVSSNGLELAPHVEALAKLEVSHVTVTINGVDPRVVSKIYKWVFVNGKRYYGCEAAEIIIERQNASVKLLQEYGILTKVNSVVIPGVNDTHIAEVAKVMAGMGAEIHNCIPLIPTAGTLFENIDAPEPELIHRVRAEAGAYLMQMNHCSRCRADACGLLGQNTVCGGEMIQLSNNASN